MTVMVKRWYRSRRFQITLTFVFITCIIYYISLSRELREANLDLTRRDDLHEYVEKKLEEALKLDQGTGCEIPYSDPFSPEIMKFNRNMSKIKCDGTDWVKCYLSKCKVVDKIISTTHNITCTYYDIIYDNDHNYHLTPGTDIKGNGVYKLIRSDHVKIRCIGTHNNSLFPSKWLGYSLGFRSKVHRIRTPPSRKDTLNVLIFVFDSTSRNGFIRKMPNSYKFLKEEIKGTILEGYNIVGDGTPAALFPILTGKTELELPDVRKATKNSGTLDDMPFIFYKLKKDGYRTAYFEDMPWIGTFQYRFKGFKKQPADHYLRAFFLDEAATSQRQNKKPYSKYYCVGDTPQYELMMNITEQFFKLDGKKFGFTFIADITHDNFNMISTADDATVKFMSALKNGGHLENTLLFVMGDHGARYANLRSTLQGKLEERLPLMFIRLPEKLIRDRPLAFEALKINAHLLTTPHDIHATVLDALGLAEYSNMYKVRGASIPRAMSLFDAIPKNRSCSEAGIEPHWCVCVSWNNVTRDDKFYERAALSLVNFINQLTEPKRVQCEPRYLTSIAWVMRNKPNKNMLAFIGAKDADGYVGKFDPKIKIKQENYQVKISVGPGNGDYEASMLYMIEDDKFVIDVRDISRTNAYGEEPSCISATDPHLNMYCYCKKYLN